MTDLSEAIDRWRSAAVEHTELAGILDAAARADEVERGFDLRWDANMRGIKRWQDTTGRTLTWPDHADLVVWLLNERDREKRKSWWDGAMWGVGSVTMGIIVVLAFI